MRRRPPLRWHIRLPHAARPCRTPERSTFWEEKGSAMAGKLEERSGAGDQDVHRSSHGNAERAAAEHTHSVMRGHRDTGGTAGDSDGAEGLSAAMPSAGQRNARSSGEDVADQKGRAKVIAGVARSL